MTLFKCVMAVAVLLVSTACLSAPSKLSREFDLGYAASSGNSESESLSLNAKIEFGDKDQLFHLGEAKVFSGSKNGKQSAEKYFLAYQINQQTSEDHAVFGRMSYDDDRFSGYEYQATATAGWAANWKMPEKQVLGTELGLGYRINEFKVGPSLEEPVLRLALDYALEVTDTSNFEQSVTAEIGDESTVTKAASSFRVSITDGLALKLSLNAKHFSKPELGRKSLDTETIVSIAYKY